MKIALGTVQFGLNYGISNTNGIPSDLELSKILNLAKQNNITVLDTALAYGNAEQRIAPFLNNDFSVVTKFKPLTIKDDLNENLSCSLESLNKNTIYGYLAHDANSLISNPDLWFFLKEKKEANILEKIGYSLYEPHQLEKLIALDCLPDIVQIPFSILDRKFIDYLPWFKENKVEVHCRSVFLQGLYFMNPSELPSKLIPLKKVLEKFHEICDDFKLTASQVALNYVIQNDFVDYAVIGVENHLQLQENINLIEHWDIKNNKVFKEIEAIIIEDEHLLNPANWSK